MPDVLVEKMKMANYPDLVCASTNQWDDIDVTNTGGICTVEQSCFESLSLTTSSDSNLSLHSSNSTSSENLHKKTMPQKSEPEEINSKHEEIMSADAADKPTSDTLQTSSSIDQVFVKCHWKLILPTLKLNNDTLSSCSSDGDDGWSNLSSMLNRFNNTNNTISTQYNSRANSYYITTCMQRIIDTVLCS